MRSTSRGNARTIIVALGLALQVSASFGADRAARPPADVQQTIDRLMECDDCSEGQQQAVVKMGAAALPALSRMLREGPSPERRERARRDLQAAYRQLQEYQKRNPRVRVDLTEEEYVRTYSDNLTARYAIRAATALGAIGGPAARKALQEALATTLRPDVQVVVRKVLGGKTKR